MQSVPGVLRLLLASERLGPIVGIPRRVIKLLMPNQTVSTPSFIRRVAPIIGTNTTLAEQEFAGHRLAFL